MNISLNPHFEELVKSKVESGIYNSVSEVLDRIQERCLALSGFPQMGINREELNKGLRSQPVGNYLVFYFPLEDGVDIVRVIHGSRDIDSLL